MSEKVKAMSNGGSIFSRSTRICKECEGEKDSEYCKFCKKHTDNSKVSIVIKEVAGTPLESAKGKIRERKNKKPYMEFRTGNLQSGDPNLPKGVNFYQSADRKNNKWDQTVVDRNTGEIIHEEHVPLDQHLEMSKGTFDI